MRAAPLIAILLLASGLALSLPPAAGAAAEPLLTDEEGDAKLESGPGIAPAAAAPGGEHADAADLVSLALEETDETLRFTLAVKGLTGLYTGATYVTDFSWGRQAFRIEMEYGAADMPEPLGGEYAVAYLQRAEGDSYEQWAWLPLQVDAASGTLSTEVSKYLVLDRDSRPPGKGDSITDLQVRSSRQLALFGGSWTARFTDEMGVDAPASYVLQKGDFSSGNLIMSSVDRVRVSNGGATTFVFKLNLKNTADAADEYEIAVADAPEGWKVTVESPLRVPASSDRTIAVLASVPFAHEHGGFDAFNVTVQSTRDPATAAKMRLGVLHTPIPQPAGHHPDLYLHAPDYENDPISEAFEDMFPYGWAYMNTESAHDGERPHVSPNAWSDDDTRWSLWMNPGLRMGLDFDVTKTGKLDAAIRSPIDATGTILATLYYVNRDDSGDWEETALAESAAIPITLTRDQDVAFAADLEILPEADYIPYARYQNLYLDLRLQVDEGFSFGYMRPNPVEPKLAVESFKLNLPLLEYHDRLSGVSEGTSVLELVALTEVEKAARPGTVVTYQFDLKNNGNHDIVVDVDVAGGDALLGTVVPGEPVLVEAGMTRTVTLGVEVPSDAVDAQELEVLVFAHAVDDPSLSAVARTKTTVTPGEGAVADERDILLAAREAENETPGPGALAGLAAVGAAALALRPRRRSG